MFGTDRPSTVTVKDASGMTLATLAGVSLNTVCVALPHIIADSLVRGHGDLGTLCDAFDSTESELRDVLGDWFNNNLWKYALLDSGTAQIFGLTVDAR